MNFRRLFASWLFALTLLCGQATAFAHALGHLHERDADLRDKVCEVCVAQAQLGSVAPPSPYVLAIPPGKRIELPANPSGRIDLAPRPACARAPPVSVYA